MDKVQVSGGNEIVRHECNGLIEHTAVGKTEPRKNGSDLCSKLGH
jgi:hypothetical protein